MRQVMAVWRDYVTSLPPDEMSDGSVGTLPPDKVSREFGEIIVSHPLMCVIAVWGTVVCSLPP